MKEFNVVFADVTGNPEQDLLKDAFQDLPFQQIPATRSNNSKSIYMKKFTLFLFAMFIGVVSVFAATPDIGSITHYVSTSGSDAVNDGSSSSPWATISWAVAHSFPGDTIKVLGGIYTESFLVVGEGIILAAGASPDCVTVSDLTMSGTETLEIELFGPTICTQYDSWTVTNTADIGGADLDLKLFYAPAPGATFTILTAGTLSSNQFADGTLVTATYNSIDYDFSITYNAGASGSIVLTSLSTPPALTACPGNISTTADAGNCSAVVNYTVTASGYPAPTYSYVFTGNTTGSGSGTGSGLSFNVGTTAVDVTATNDHGQVTCTFTIIVTDDENPSVTCPANINANTSTGSCNTLVYWAVPVTADNCGVASSVATGNNGAVIVPGSPVSALVNKGVTTITYTVTDVNSNVTTCNFTVTVTDVEPPVITYSTSPYVACPPNVTVNNLTDFCYNYAGWTAPTPSDNCPGVSMSSNYFPTGSTTPTQFPIGNTLVRYTAIDAAGNSSTCTFTVTVLDNQFPEITCPVGQTKNTDLNQCNYTTIGTEFDPTVADDNCPNPVLTYTLSGATTAGPVTASTLAGVDFLKGITTVTWRITDASANFTECSFTVTVSDIEAPRLTTSSFTDANVYDACIADAASTVPAFNQTNARVGYEDNCTSNANLNCVLTGTAVTGDNCNWTVTYTYNVVDEVGNSYTGRTYSHNGGDNSGPNLVLNPPAPVTGINTCLPTQAEADAAFDATYAASFYSDCSGGVTATLDLATITGTDCSWSVDYMFSVTDACGNTRAEQTYIRTGADLTLPTASTFGFGGYYSPANWASSTNGNGYTNSAGAPASITIVGSNNSYLSTPTLTNFSIPVTVAGTISFDWNYQSNNSASYWDQFGYTLNGTFYKLTSDAGPYTGSTTQNGSTSISVNIGDVFGFRIHSVDDAAGNAYTTVTNFTHPVTPITFSNVNACSADALTAAPFNGPLIVTGYADNCTGALTAVKTGEALTGTDCNWTITYTYNIMDACGNSITGETYTHSGSDQTAPTGTAPVAQTGTNACYANALTAAPFNATLAAAGYTDNCGGVVTATKTGESLVGDNCAWTITYTFTVTDECGNPLTSQTYTHSGSDQTAPTGTAPVAQTGTNACYANALTAAPFNATLAAAGYTDNCGGVVTATKTGETLTGDNCAWTITYTFTVTDECGNPLASQTYTHSGSDQTAPTLKDNLVDCITLNDLNNNECLAVAATFDYTTLYGPVAALYEDNCGGSVTVTLINTYDDELIGGNTDCDWWFAYEYKIFDQCGNSTTCMVVRTGGDTETPAIAGPTGTLTKNTDPGLCTYATVGNEFDLTSITDNCTVTPTTAYSINGAPYVTATTLSGYVFSKGITTVTWRATDNCNNTAYWPAFNVEVKDLELPVVACPPSQSVFTGPLSCNIQVSWTEPVPTDNCPGVSLSVSTNPFTALAGTAPVIGLFEKGINYVTYTATDASGNTSSCTFTITVVDNVIPKLENCPGNIQVFTAPNLCESAPVSWTPPTPSDNCPGWLMTTTHNPNSVFQLGVTTVTYTNTDAVGLTTTCSFNVTVADNQPPFVTAATDITAYTNANGNLNDCISEVAVPDAVYGDNCAVTLTWAMTGAVTASGTGQIGTYNFPKGITTITYTVTENYNPSPFPVKTATDVMTVTVIDNEIPRLTGTQFTDPTNWDGCLATAETHVPAFNQASAIIGFEDNCTANGNLVAQWTATNVTGTNCNWTVTYVYDVIDESGNILASQSYSHSGSDQTDPVWVVAPSDKTVECDGAGNVADLNAWLASFSGSDVCGSTPTVTHNFTALSDDCGATGKATVTFTLTDECGNFITQDATFTIEDTTDPYWVVAPSDKTVECDGAGNLADLNAWLASFSGTDICGGSAVVTNNFTALSDLCGATGSATVTFTLTDPCGNDITMDATFTIEDTTPASFLTVPGNIAVNSGTTFCGATVDWWIPTFSDVCGTSAITNVTYLPSISNFINLGGGHMMATFDKGITTVTYYVSDDCGNVTTTSFTVTVTDVTPPIIHSTITVVNGQNAVGQCGNQVFWYQPITATDNCPGVQLTSTHYPGAWFPVGTTLVTYTATDAANLTTTYSFNVVVADTSKPVLAGTLPGGAVGNVCFSALPAAPAEAAIAALYTDNCGPVNAILLSSNISGDDCSWTAIYTYSVDDSHGNYANNAVITYTGGDTEAPSLVNVNTTCASLNISAQDECLAIATAWDATQLETAVAALYKDNCDPAVTATLIGTVAGANNTNCSWIFTYTYRIEDNCQNFITCEVTREGGNKQLPTLVNVPADVTANCDNIPMPANVTATDYCGVAATVTLTQASTQGTDPELCSYYSYTITNTWLAVDECGNSKTAQQVITVIDITKPVLVGVPANTTVNCHEVPQPAPVTATDNCDATPAVVLNEISTQDPNVANCGHYTYVIERTWTATDACGNNASTTQIINVQDVTAPVFVVPGPVTIQKDNLCQYNANPNVTGVPTQIVEACDQNPAVTYTDALSVGSCAHETVITRTWTVTDACNNATSQDQIITVQDKIAPVLTIPADAVVQKGALCVYDASPAVTGYATATDNCDAAPVVTFSDVMFTGQCPNDDIITRTWLAVDACGNSTTGVQYILVEDNVAPVLVGVPADVTVACDAVPAPANVTATDNCDPMPMVSFTEVSSQNPDLSVCGHYTYTITRTWTATDACGNSTSSTQTIQVEDIVAPTFTVPQDITIYKDAQCGYDANTQITGYPTQISDNCMAQPLVSFSDATAPGSCVGETIITRTWTVTDACQNATSLDQIITVKDVTAPVLAGVPQDVTVDCDNIPVAAQVTVTDNCDPYPVLNYNEYTTKGTDPALCSYYNYTLTRVWDAEDDCGNVTSSTQIITVHDVTAPQITAPQAATIYKDANCNHDADPMYTGSPVVSDNCMATPTVTFNDQVVAGQCVGQLIITRTWMATDACGNSATDIQYITVLDLIAPILTGTLPGGNVGNVCKANAPVAPATTVIEAEYTDNCSNVTATLISSSLVGTDAGWTATYEYVVSDDCGNTTTAVVVYTGADSEAPVITCPQDITQDADQGVCEAYLQIVDATATDNCSVASIVGVRSDALALNAAYPVGITTITWTATDAAGNSASCVQTITIEDNELPTITCPQVAQEYFLNDGCYYYADDALNVSATMVSDNCGIDMIVHNYPNAVSAYTLDGAWFPIGTTTVTWTVYDIHGNSATCSYDVVVKGYTLDGNFSYYRVNFSPATMPLDNITVNLKDGSNNVIATTLTDATGYYKFTDLCLGEYFVDATSTKPHGSIQATDAVQAFFWGVTPTPIEKVRFRAGDVDNSNFIDPGDAINMLNYFLTGGVPQWTTIWKFWQAGDNVAVNFPSPALNVPYPTVVVTGDLNVNFYGMLNGDFNGSYQPVPGLKSTGSVILHQGETIGVKAGQKFTLPVEAKMDLDVTAITLAMNYPADKVTVKNVTLAGSNTPVKFSTKNGELRIAYTTLLPMVVKNGETMLTLHLEASSSLKKGEQIIFTLTQNPDLELADAMYQVIPGAELTISKVESTTGITEKPADNLLTLTNYPNPFVNNTTFAYNLPVSGKVNLVVYDMVGRKVAELIDENQVAGSYTLPVDTRDLRPGAYTASLRVETTDGALLTRTIRVISHK